LMRQVAAHMNSISTLLPEGFHVGINFSASHIDASTFVEECLRYKRGFIRQDLNLVIEVTEREPLHIDEHLVKTLNELHKIGFAIALDDFGTGYSGLSYLQALHIDYIKIDQSFVARVNASEDSTVILDSVLELAKKFNSEIHILNVQKKDSSLNQGKIIGKMKASLVFSKLNHQFHTINERNVEEGINKFIEKKPTNILAMVAHKHTLFERMFGKVYTKEMSYQTKIPLLVLQSK